MITQIVVYEVVWRAHRYDDVTGLSNEYLMHTGEGNWVALIHSTNEGVMPRNDHMKVRHARIVDGAWQIDITGVGAWFSAEAIDKFTQDMIDFASNDYGGVYARN